MSPDMEEWVIDRERHDLEELRARFNPWNLAPERTMNLSTLRGQQDAQNKVSYTEWSRDAKDHIKSKGKSGRLLVSMLEFADGYR